jgi:hypothetical protein
VCEERGGQCVRAYGNGEDKCRDNGVPTTSIRPIAMTISVFALDLELRSSKIGRRPTGARRAKSGSVLMRPQWLDRQIWHIPAWGCVLFACGRINYQSKSLTSDDEVVDGSLNGSDHGASSPSDASSASEIDSGGISHRWRFVSAGVVHTCAIETSGTLWCWGQGTSGKLGLG